MTETRYANPETLEKIEQAHEELEKEEEEGGDGLPNMSTEEQSEARQVIAAEEQPDGEVPDLRVTETVEFRGHGFEFTEMGATQLEASQFSDMDDGDVEQGTKAGNFVYRALGECGVNTDESYWRQYDLQASGDTEGVMDLFNKVIEAFNDVDPEELERAGNSP